MKVIALGIKLAEENGEINKLKLEPKKLEEFRPKKFSKIYN